MPRMTAMRYLRYAGKPYKAGESFEATDKAAHALKLIGKARYEEDLVMSTKENPLRQQPVAADVSISSKPPDVLPIVPKNVRGYERREMEVSSDKVASSDEHEEENIEVSENKSRRRYKRRDMETEE